MAAPFSILEELESAKGPMDAKRVAQILGISAKSVYKAAQTKAIPSVRVLGALRFDPRVLSYWYRKQHPAIAAAGKASL